MFHLQTQLIPNPSSPERNDEAPLAPCLNRSLPIQETGHMVNQHSTTSPENHANFVQEPDTNLHLKDFGGVIAVSEDDTEQIEVLIFTNESTPAIVEELD